MYIINEGQNPSGSDNLNILYKEKNVYIMDNHLAAIWCWYQALDLSHKYSLLHIDQHYDLGINQIKEGKALIKKNKLNISTISATELTGYKVYNKHINPPLTQLFLWDNYINLFRLLNPKVIDETIFATQQQGSFNYKKKGSLQVENWDLQNGLSYLISKKHNGSKKWIVNLDIDYFFANYYCDGDCVDGEEEFIFQYLTDDFIRIICREIRKELNNVIAVLTISMSPECCGGWSNTIRVINIIAEELGLTFRM